ncbi:MAG: hypothetical protein QW039_03810 [Fervidicoccaceae archaeon]
MAYANISGKHACLSRAEMLSLLENKEGFREIASFTGVELFEIGDLNSIVWAQSVSSTLKSVGKVLLILGAKGEIRHFACPDSIGEVEIRRMQGMNREMGRERALKTIEGLLRDRCGNLEGGQGKVEIFLTDGVIIVGESLSSKGKGELMSRNPHTLPFYKPGALNPWFARLLVNLASPFGGKAVYDPFCGVGTILLAASELWNIELLCSDIRRDMCAGSKANLGALSPQPFEIVRADALHLPMRRGAFSHVVSDPPYNRSIRSLYSAPTELLSGALQQISETIEKGGRIVISIDEDLARSVSIPEGVFLKHKCPMYVHNRLTRAVMVMVKE